MNAETTPRLGPLPPAFPATVAALHRVAEQIVSPGAQARQRDRAEGDARRLRHARCSTTTASRRQVRVDGAELVHRAATKSAARRCDARRARRSWPSSCSPRSATRRSTSIRAAARLADWYAFGARPRSRTSPRDDPTPALARALRHRDRARRRGARARAPTTASRRATSTTPSPTPTSARGPRRSRGELWQATGFRGAELTYAELLAATDQRAAALEFFTHPRTEARA